MNSSQTKEPAKKRRKRMNATLKDFFRDFFLEAYITGFVQADFIEVEEEVTEKEKVEAALFLAKFN